MAKLSPLQRVRKEHGSKAELAEKVLDILDVPEDEDPMDFEHRISTLSNRKLLRLWDSHELVQDQFGSKGNLVDQIVDARFPGGNDDYADKISTFTLPKLLGLARQFEVL